MVAGVGMSEILLLLVMAGVPVNDLASLLEEHHRRYGQR